jgi:PPOX class probable F420-dependent enzyme
MSNKVEEARTFIRENHRGILATFRLDGRPQMSPVTQTVDDEGYVCISTRKTAFKTKNLRRDPRVSLCAINDKFFGQWMQIDGTAQIVELPQAMDGLVAYYRAAAGEHPNWDEYRAAMEKEQRVLVRIAIERAGPDRQG